MNVYMFDFVFFAVYLFARYIFICMHDNEYKIYMDLRPIAVWMEFVLILTFFYAAPAHTASEAGVSFFMGICSKFVFDFISCPKCPKKEDIK